MRLKRFIPALLVTLLVTAAPDEARLLESVKQ